MKRNIITSLFITTLLLLSFLLFSCSNEKINTQNENSFIRTEKNCITKIIAFDDSLGTLRNNACRQISLSKTILNYTLSLGSLNFENCPKQFSVAFKTHIKAWTNMLEVTDKYPELRGEMHDLFDQIKLGSDSTKYKLLEKEIWSTWTEIEKQIPNK